MLTESRVLVVDDTVANLEIASEVLMAAGYTVSTVLDSERAFKRMQTYLPDLILLDVHMPGMNGFEMCQRLKADPATAAIPIIFMTALSDSHNKVYGLSLGAVDYITKPFQEAELLARVKTHIQLYQLTKNLEQRVLERTAELEAALHQLSHSQLQQIQHEKMAALGGLVAGVAHEINNPIGFLKGSVVHGKEHISYLLNHLALYQQYYPNPVDPIQHHAEDIDLEFLGEDLPKLLDSMERATNYITNISASLRAFSRDDTAHAITANPHDGLDSALLILKYRLKANERRPAIEVIQDYGDMPEIDCFPGQLNQVFMNLLANAIDMFDELAQEKSWDYFTAHPPQITICTGVLASQVQIVIRDNGKGISQELQAKIFDQTFTTKAVGKGTGLGLAISRQIVVEKHGGSLEVQSELGKGSEFRIRLPIDAAR